MLRDWEKQLSRAASSRSSTRCRNVVPSHLLDRRLYDFAACARPACRTPTATSPSTSMCARGRSRRACARIGGSASRWCARVRSVTDAHHAVHWRVGGGVGTGARVALAIAPAVCGRGSLAAAGTARQAPRCATRCAAAAMCSTFATPRPTSARTTSDDVVRGLRAAAQPHRRGRADARAIGAAIAALQHSVGDVLASPFCRTRETAQLVFGRATRVARVRGGPARTDDAQRYAALATLLSARRCRRHQSRRSSATAIRSQRVAGPPYLAEGEAAVDRAARQRRLRGSSAASVANGWPTLARS